MWGSTSSHWRYAQCDVNSCDCKQAAQQTPEAIAKREAAAAKVAAVEAASEVVHEDNEWKIEVVPEDEAAPTGSGSGGGGGGTSAAASEGAPRHQQHQQLAEGLQFSHVRLIQSCDPADERVFFVTCVSVIALVHLHDGKDMVCHWRSLRCMHCAWLARCMLS